MSVGDTKRIKLVCEYMTHAPGKVLELPAKTADRLIKSKMAVEVGRKVVSGSDLRTKAGA